jgi:transcriptional regulator with XRE-family HTH domain
VLVSRHVASIVKAEVSGQWAPRALHGPKGRIRLARELMGMRQFDFARAVGVSRETVSHWENLDELGQPRQRITERNAAVIARLLSECLNEPIDGTAFYEQDESPLDAALREVVRLRATQDVLIREQRRLTRDVGRVVALIEQLRCGLDRLLPS